MAVALCRWPGILRWACTMLPLPLSSGRRRSLLTIRSFLGLFSCMVENMADKCWKRSKSKSNLPKPIAFKPCCFLHAFAAWVLLKSSDQGWIGRERNLPGATGVAQKVGLAWLVASLHPWSVQLNYVEPMYLIWWHIIHQTQMAKTCQNLVCPAGNLGWPRHSCV